MLEKADSFYHEQGLNIGVNEFVRTINTKMRHPQATGEVFLFWVTALLLNSPFLAIFSLIYIPMFIITTYAEEQDLLLRYGDAYAEYRRNTGAF